ncbi:MAG TPA: hypothetical protein DEO88_15210, partial [Syntrophobacteraceae bacterium]|nr:hypothetical protein [Syntrophobacteraceae bacterium]
SYRQPLLERFQELLRNTPAEVNRDPQPISVLYGFCLSESVSHLETVGSVGRWVLKLLDAIASGRMDVTLIIAVAMSILLLAVAGCKRTRWGSEKLAGLNSVTLMALATGTFGTVAMVSLLFIHQNLSGYIYVELGIPSSAFLGGLGLGLLLAERSNDRFALRLLGMTLMMVGVCLVSSHLLQWVFSFGARTWSVHVATSALSSLSGIGVGATFSFLAAINRQRGRQQPRAWIHVAEMVGASAAAVATNVFFIPVLGVAKVFYLEALLLVVAAVTLLAGEVHRHRSSEVSRPER